MCSSDLTLPVLVGFLGLFAAGGALVAEVDRDNQAPAGSVGGSG